jgi:hypothetical protein
MKAKRIIPWIEYLVPVLVIIVAFIGVLGLIPIPFEKLVILLLGFLAVDTLVERTSFFQKLRNQIDKLRTRKGLRSRLDPDFQPFSTYCSGAQDVFLCGLSLGFVAPQQRFFFEDRLRNGCNFRMLIVDPDLPPEALKLIADHDERGEDPDFAQYLRDELKSSVKTLKGFNKMARRTGHLEIRAAKGLPVFTITMVNPQHDSGKMRVELRPYKRNSGVRPYIELVKMEADDRLWYDFFFSNYYEMLWQDSKVIVRY